MSEQEIKIGSVVELKSANDLIKMVVTIVHDDKTVAVAWDAGDGIHRDMFPLECLKLVE